MRSVYDFGDSWEDIKADHNEVFEVRDEPDHKQLRRKVSDDAGRDGYFISFHLDAEGKVESFSAKISGNKQNAVTVRALLDDVIAHFDKTIGPGTCGDTVCDWQGVPGKPWVNVRYQEMSDPIRGMININIMWPKSEP